MGRNCHNRDPSDPWWDGSSGLQDCGAGVDAMNMTAAIPINASVDVLQQLMAAVVNSGASDLHLRVGSPPFVRAGGQLVAIQSGAFETQLLMDLIRLTAGDTPVPSGASSFEYSYDHQASARFRVHVFRERGHLAMCLRFIPFRVPTFAELRLPAAIKTLATSNPGLVLITGATGSGKSTTAASMLNHLAAQEAVHLLTVEDPVEFRFTAGKSCVSQREVGRDTPSYLEALRGAMREDPDVLFVGEIRDAEALDVALHAAESGHAVFSTFHTHGGLKTIQRIIASFPSEEQTNARNRLADALRGVVSQLLLPRKGLRARVLATELTVNNYRVKECIRDPQRTASLPQVLEKGADQGMHTFDQSLTQLVRDGHITVETAMIHAASPADFKRMLVLAGVQE